MAEQLPTCTSCQRPYTPADVAKRTGASVALVRQYLAGDVLWDEKFDSARNVRLRAIGEAIDVLNYRHG